MAPLELELGLSLAICCLEKGAIELCHTAMMKLRQIEKMPWKSFQHNSSIRSLLETSLDDINHAPKFRTIPKLIQTMIYFDNHSFVILVLCSLLRRNKSLRISTLSDSYKQQHYIPINYTCLNPKWLTGCADKFFGDANIFNRNRVFLFEKPFHEKDSLWRRKK